MSESLSDLKHRSLSSRRKWLILAFVLGLPVFVVVRWFCQVPSDIPIFTRQILLSAKTGERLTLYWYPHSEFTQMACPLYFRAGKGSIRLLDDIEHEDAGGTAPVQLTQDRSALFAITKSGHQTFGAAYIFKTRSILQDDAAGAYLKAHPTFGRNLLLWPEDQPQPARLYLSRWQLYRMGLPYDSFF